MAEGQELNLLVTQTHNYIPYMYLSWLESWHDWFFWFFVCFLWCTSYRVPWLTHCVAASCKVLPKLSVVSIRVSKCGSVGLPRLWCDLQCYESQTKKSPHCWAKFLPIKSWWLLYIMMKGRGLKWPTKVEFHMDWLYYITCLHWSK